MSTDTLSLIQHHDGISGTETNLVAYDYWLRMTAAFSKSQDKYKKNLVKYLDLQNIKIGQSGLETCNWQMMNDTVLNCTEYNSLD